MPFSLILLGTDTYYLEGTQTSDDQNNLSFQKFGFMPHGETLSTLFNAIQGEGATITRASRSHKPVGLLNELHNKNKVLFEGPETLGTDVGDIIARATLVALEKFAAGERTMALSGHSRGGVEAILVCHEIERILLDIQQSPHKSLNEILLESPCPYTKAAMQNLLQTEPAIINRINANKKSIPTITDIKIDLFVMDPVPGGSIAGLGYVGKIAWRDNRFYTIPACVSAFTQVLMQHENTRCFKPIVPKAHSSLTRVHVDSLPGNHGTASGNPRGQQNEKIFPDGAPELEAIYAIQRVVYIKLLEQYQGNGVAINSAYHKDILPTAGIANLDKLHDLKIEYLDCIAKYAESLGKEYLKYAYQGLGREAHVYIPLLGSIPIPYYQQASRIIHHHNGENHLLAEASMMGAAGYANKEHEILKQERAVKEAFAEAMDSQIVLEQRLTHFQSALLSTSKEFENHSSLIMQFTTQFIKELSFLLLDINKSIPRERIASQIMAILTALKAGENNSICKDAYQAICETLNESIPLLSNNYINAYQTIVTVFPKMQDRVAPLMQHIEQIENVINRLTDMKTRLQLDCRQDVCKIEQAIDCLSEHSIEINAEVDKIKVGLRIQAIRQAETEARRTARIAAAEKAAIEKAATEKATTEKAATKKAAAEKAAAEKAATEKLQQNAYSASRQKLEELVSNVKGIFYHLRMKMRIFSGHKHIDDAKKLFQHAEEAYSSVIVKNAGSPRFFTTKSITTIQEAYLRLVAILQTQFDVGVKEWLKKNNTQTRQGYVDYLNTDRNKHHFYRAINNLLMNAYEDLGISNTQTRNIKQ